MKKKQLKNLDEIKYYVREDTNNARPTQIHSIKCNHFKNSKKIQSASSIWHGPYAISKSVEIAKKISKKRPTGWSKAGCCILPRPRRSIKKL